MATGYFSAMGPAGKTVYFHFYDPATDKRFDFGDDTWQASPTDPKLAAAEQTEMGDADESLYTANTDLANMNDTSTAMEVIVQAVDDLATDELIGTSAITVINGDVAGGGGALPSTPTLTVSNDGDGDAVTATVAGDDSALNKLYYRKASDTAWTIGENRAGDGDIAQAGLDDGEFYWFMVISVVAGVSSVSSLQVMVYVSSGTITHTYEIVHVGDVKERGRWSILFCTEILD